MTLPDTYRTKGNEYMNFTHILHYQKTFTLMGINLLYSELSVYFL